MPQHVEPSLETDPGNETAGPSEPPVGPIWDSPVGETPLVLLDLEMTGLDPEFDAIVEVAFVRTVGGRAVSELSTLVQTDVPARPAAFALHGIEPAALASAPRFEALAPRIAALLEGAVPVAHGTALDVEFLSRAMRSAGHAPDPLRHVIDSVTLARRAIAAPSYTLSGLSTALGLPPRRWHRAREDVAGLEQLLPVLVRELAPVSARDLWEVRVGQRERVRVRRAIAAALASLAASGARCVVVGRTPGRAPFRFECVIERWAPPHATLVGRGAVKVLRADRILRIEQ